MVERSWLALLRGVAALLCRAGVGAGELLEMVPRPDASLRAVAAAMHERGAGAGAGGGGGAAAEDDMDSAPEALRSLHERYLHAVMAACFMTPGAADTPAVQCLAEAVRMCLTFSDRLRTLLQEKGGCTVVRTAMRRRGA